MWRAFDRSWKVIRKNQHCSLRSLGSATNLFPHSARYSQSYDGDRPFSILTINSLNWTVHHSCCIMESLRSQRAAGPSEVADGLPAVLAALTIS